MDGQHHRLVRMGVHLVLGSGHGPECTGRRPSGFGTWEPFGLLRTLARMEPTLRDRRRSARPDARDDPLLPRAVLLRHPPPGRADRCPVRRRLLGGGGRLPSHPGRGALRGGADRLRRLLSHLRPPVRGPPGGATSIPDSIPRCSWRPSWSSEYLFPLDETKIVTVAFGPRFTYFGFVTLFFTALGVLTYLFGLVLGLPFLDQAGDAWTVAYLVSLFAMTLGSIVRRVVVVRARRR